MLDANDAPTDLLLEPTFIAENRPEGTEVGTFRQTDPDGEYDPLDTGEEIEQTEFFNETFPGNALEDGWVEELNNAESWTYSVKNNKLEIQEIKATVHNTDSDGQWGIVTLTQPITPLADFTATVEMAWDQNNKKEATQEMFVVLLGPDDQLIASVGIYDEWIRYKGVKFTSLAENDYMTSIDSLSHKATHDVKVTAGEKRLMCAGMIGSSQLGSPTYRLRVTGLFCTYPATKQTGYNFWRTVP